MADNMEARLMYLSGLPVTVVLRHCGVSCRFCASHFVAEDGWKAIDSERHTVGMSSPARADPSPSSRRE